MLVDISALHVSRAPVEVQPAAIGEIDHAIAEIVAAYIQDGAVIQVGIGAVPEAILQRLHDRRDLGVHSGMVGDGQVDLVEAGVITNARKPIDQGVSITGALIGTRRLFDFADRNPQLSMRDSSYTHNQAILSRLKGLVTINSAIEVDLTGQVNAEQGGSRYLGGTGGQVDYVRAGSRSPGGRSIIALPATAMGGKISRITAALAGPVTTARTEVDVIVTEFGAAELKGQTLAERARRLVAIAHPDFHHRFFPGGGLPLYPGFWFHGLQGCFLIYRCDCLARLFIFYRQPDGRVVNDLPRNVQGRRTGKDW
ncbi:MAG: acyl-CoA hydrolase [Lysobacterales bacterium]